jgi:hypothetical protein
MKKHKRKRPADPAWAKPFAILVALSWPFYGSVIAMDNAKRSPVMRDLTASVRGPQPVVLRPKETKTARVIDAAHIAPGCDRHDWLCIWAADDKQRNSRR